MHPRLLRKLAAHIGILHILYIVSSSFESVGGCVAAAHGSGRPQRAVRAVRPPSAEAEPVEA
eukprot:3413792-Prymnesium_polylepis.1